MKKLPLFILLPFLSLPAISNARLGETVQQNEARYGKPVKNYNDKNHPILKKADNRTYHYQGWIIRIGYFNERAVRMSYGKLPKPGTTQQLKPYEIEAVLNAEAHGGSWKKMRPSNLFRKRNSGSKGFDTAQQRWINTNKSLAYSPNGHFIVYFDTPQAIIWEQALKNEKEVQRKESLPAF